MKLLRSSTIKIISEIFLRLLGLDYRFVKGLGLVIVIFNNLKNKKKN